MARTTLRVIDAHTAGEPLRLVTGGVPEIPGETMIEKRRWVREHLDWVRRSVLWEPRGHADMYGALLTEPVTPDGDAGVLFMHNAGYSSMCGHGVIALATILGDGSIREDGLPLGAGASTIRFDTPAGRVVATLKRDDERVAGVTMRNVPSFVVSMDSSTDVAGIGRVDYDVAFGGAFYAFCDASRIGIDLDGKELRRIIDLGRRIKAGIAARETIEHPFEKDLSELYGVIFTAPARKDDHHSRHVCVFADGEVDRSPTGTGVSARAALLVERGELRLGQTITIESLIGTTFTVTPTERAQPGGYSGVVSEVVGRAFLIGRTELVIDDDDPCRHGFFLR